MQLSRWTDPCETCVPLHGRSQAQARQNIGLACATCSPNASEDSLNPTVHNVQQAPHQEAMHIAGRTQSSATPEARGSPISCRGAFFFVRVGVLIHRLLTGLAMSELTVTRETSGYGSRLYGNQLYEADLVRFAKYPHTPPGSHP
jgi:hypothetical protein